MDRIVLPHKRVEDEHWAAARQHLIWFSRRRQSKITGCVPNFECSRISKKSGVVVFSSSYNWGFYLVSPRDIHWARRSIFRIRVVKKWLRLIVFSDHDTLQKYQFFIVPTKRFFGKYESRKSDNYFHRNWPYLPKWFVISVGWIIGVNNTYVGVADHWQLRCDTNDNCLYWKGAIVWSDDIRLEKEG